MMHIIPDIFLRAICWTLLHSLWQGLIVAMIAGIIMVLTKRSSSSLRYNLLCGLLFLFLGISGYTFYRQLPLPSQSAVISPSVAVAQQSVPEKHTIAPAAGAVVQTGIDSLIQYFNTHASLIVLVWFIIFIGRFVKLLSALVYTQRIRHYQTNSASAEWQQRLRDLMNKVKIGRPVLLLESALIKVPVVVGFLKPAILVPVGMLAHISSDQVESILLHELAHIRRQDYLLNLVQNLVDTLFFFNPAMIWISSLIRAERENCCDDIAIRETRSRRRLIEALVSFHEYEKSNAGYILSFAAKENQVVRRVKRIVHKKNHSLNTGERVLLTSGLLILCAAFITVNGSRANAPAKTAKTQRATIFAAPKSTLDKPAGSVSIDVPEKPAAKPAQKPVQLPSPSSAQALVPTPALAVDTTPRTQTSTNLYQNASVDLIIEAKEHGVTPEFVGELQRMGYRDLSLQKAITLVDHGVNAEFIRSVQKMGYTDISLDMAIKLVDHGVNPEYIERIRALGFTNFSLEKAITLVDHGVTADYIAGMKERMGKLFELNDYIKLMDAGISPDSLDQQ